MHDLMIMGAGPVGCYAAYRFLEEPGLRVIMFEGRKFERSQVLRIPFAVAKDFPEPIRKMLWRDAEIREQIFQTEDFQDPYFWPRPDYAYWPWVSIGDFQEVLLNYLRTQPAYQGRFFFIPHHGDLQNDLCADIQRYYPDYQANPQVVSCSCGGFSEQFRRQTNLFSGKSSEFKGPGIYWIYQNAGPENYRRGQQRLSYVDLGARGISYAAANNRAYDVQLYTYPAGKLAEIFESLPESFKERAQYGRAFSPLTLAGQEVPEDAQQWFGAYRQAVLAETERAGIVLPQDFEKIQVFYAARTEYYWEQVTAELDYPLFFIGDSAGSTDYKLGLSLGRGLLAVQKISNLISEHPQDFETIRQGYQTYWDKILSHEFNQGPQLSAEPWIQYQYLVRGRAPYFSEENYLDYLGEYQARLPDFANTREASAVVFVNTQNLRENLKRIRQFAEDCDQSQVMAVVKSHGYGLGAPLVSELARAEGISFLAVAKLSEAVNLRRSGLSASQARILVFEAPLPQDFASYAMYQIELMLPASQGGVSVASLAAWLAQKPVFSQPLRVHVMVDTGLRRDGGCLNNSSASVLQTVTAIQALNSKQAIFEGLGTHLACYRCTDYQGEDVLNFRHLQIQRLQEVLAHLFAQGVAVSCLHVGGGLALLAEQWPQYFKSFTQKFAMTLYTRVGHGIYGMEDPADLAPASPRLLPTVELNLQVRQVFHVEEGEPVSYGGYWRAPKGGAWIATLAGGWAEGLPRAAPTLGEWEWGIKVSIQGQAYEVVGRINMNAMMVNLGASTSIQAGDRAVVFGWRVQEPQLLELAKLSAQIGPSITVNLPAHLPRIVVSA